MKERPTTQPTDMVAAILAGTKQQIRQVIKPQPFLSDTGIWYPSSVPGDKRNHTGKHYASEQHMRKGLVVDFCPYGKPGDGLWVRETFRYVKGVYTPSVQYQVDANKKSSEFQDLDKIPHNWQDSRWRPSIHMPRWASRITLEITDIHVERVKEITEVDAIAEGAFDGGCTNCGCSSYPATCGCDNPTPDHIETFIELWNSINEKRGFGWDVNPWVWCIAFRRIR